MNKNNKYIIGFTCLISVLVHLILGATTPPFLSTTKNYPPITHSQSFILSLKKEPKADTPKETIKKPKNAKLKTPPKKIEQRKVAKPKNKPQPKSENNLDTSTLTSNLTSKRDLANSKAPSVKNSGSRRKGALEGTGHAKTKDKSTAQSNAKKSTTHTTQEQPSNSPKNQNTAKAPSPHNQKKKGKISISHPQKQPKTDDNQELKQLKNPVFAAIKEASSISNKAATHNLTIKDLGKLQAANDNELDNARIGDPFSEFEHQQRQVFNRFLAAMSEQVEANWDKPESSDLLQTRIKIYLTTEGFLKDIYIELSSGHALFDQRAIEAIKAVDQFAMPPHPVVAGYFTRLTMTIDNYSENSL